MEKRFILKNNMCFYTYLNPNIHSFCLSYYVKAGSIYETSNNNGISHYLEHLIIRNINKLYDNNLYKTLDKYGLSFNACTYKEFIRFYLIGPSSSISVASDIFSKLWSTIVLDDNSINVELNRIKSEIKEAKLDSEFDAFSDKIVWKGTATSLPITGTISSLNKISKKQLNEYKNMIFSSKNSFIYLTGNVNDVEIKELINNLDNINVDNTLNNTNIVSIPENFQNRSIYINQKGSNQIKVKFSFDIDTSKHSDPVYQLLYDIIFDGESCLFFQRLSEDMGLIYSYNAIMERYINVGELSFSYDVSSNNFYKSIEESINIINFAKEKLTNELDYSLPRYTLNSSMILDDVDDLNWTMAYENHILNNSYKDINERTNSFLKVAINDIKVAANDIFKPNNLTLFYEAPKSKFDNCKIESLLKKM